MRKPSEERGIFSRLPDDPAYWDELSARIVRDAAPTLSDYQDEQNQWWSALERYSTALAVGAAVAVVAAVLLIPNARFAESSPVEGSNAFGLVPESPLVGSLVSAEAPPTMETMIVLRTAERDQ